MHSPACTDSPCLIGDGLCHCGCGAVTRRASDPKRQRVAGAPYLYVRGHNPRAPQLDPRYLVTEGGCWIWQGRRGRDGYGQWKGGGGRMHTAHRRMYETLVGPVPDGLELDHLCRVPACVNPEHLEPVTHAENMRRHFRSLVGE